MTRSIHRRSLAARLLSSYVVLVVLVSFAGLGYAVPQSGKGAVDASQESTAVASIDPKTEIDAPAPEPVSEPGAVPPEADEGPSEPLPTALATTGGSTPPVVVVKESAAAIKAAPTVAPDATTVSAQLTLEGYNEVSGSWTTGNLKERQEGDWIEHRVVIDNSKGTATYVMPASTILMDHYWSNSNAIFYDKTRQWSFVSSTAVPSNTNPAQPAGASAFAMTGQDFGVGGTYGVDAPQIGSSWANGTIQVPAGHYGIVYWQAHLALSAYWMQTAGIWGAGPWSPGSPSHTWLEMTGVGAKKVPIPSVDLPAGDIAGMKFNDLANRGTYDAGEPGLGGWVFHLTGGPEGWPLDLTATSTSDGTFAFENLPPGTYYLNEESKAGWQTAYSLPLTVVITDGETVTVKVGNYRPEVTKTFELSFGENAQVGAPMGTTFFARFWMNGEASPGPDVSLSGSGGLYSGSATLPYGSLIDKVEWWASLGGQDYLLGTQYPDETLTGNVTNEFDYDSFLAGRKWHDLDADGAKDDSEPWLSGWTVELRRAADDSLYAIDVTDGDGIYNFRDVLPDEYYVVEVMQAGWFQTHAPTGTVTVQNGTEVEGLCFGNVEVLSAIDVTKNGPVMARVGDTVTYEITVTNTGHTALTNVVVSDPLFGGTIATIPVLASGASQTFHPQHTVLGGDPDPLPNTVMATGVDLLGQTKTDMASWEVDIVHPDFTLTKTVDPSVVAFEGDVLYTYEIENTGDVVLDGLTLDDDVIGPVTLPVGTLDPGQTVTVSVPWHLSDDTTNTATAVAYDPWEDPYERYDDAFVDVRDPAIQVVKSADPTVIREGEPVTYTYLITNIGDTTLTDITISDNVLGDLSYLLATTTLAPGASTTVQITVPVSDDVTNIGYVTGTYGETDSDFYGQVDDSSSADVDVIFPDLEVRKSADPTVILAGEDVTYSYEVENTGDVTLTGVTLVDDMLGPITLSDTTLDPGEIASGSITVAVSEDTTNVVTGTGYDPLGAPVTDTDEAFVDVVHPALTIDKTVSPDTIAFGGTVYYDYVVENTGDVTLFDIEVTDDIIGTIGTIDELAPGETHTFADVAWTVDADLTNVGTATGTDEWGHEATDDDDAFVDVIHPALDVSKSVEPTTVLSGEQVVYTYTVENTGDVPLYEVALEDDVLGAIGGVIPVLMPGASVSTEVPAIIDEDTPNVVVGEGWFAPVEPGAAQYLGRVTDEADAYVEVVAPAIDVEKSATPGVIVYSGEVVYEYTITNTGDTPLFDVDASDDQLGVVAENLTLGVDESVVVTIAATIDEDTTNVVDVTGVDAWGHPVADSADEFVDVINPGVSIDKTVDPEVILAGEDVVYTYVVQNTGDTLLWGLWVDDDQLGPVGTHGPLAPGDSWTFTVPAAIDVDTANVATVTAGFGFADEIDGEPAMFDDFITDSDDAYVEVVAPAIDVVKTGSTDSVVEPGEDVVYTYEVTNVGDVPLFDVSLVDDQLGAVGATGVLAVGESMTFTATDFIGADTTNTVVATGEDEWGHEVSASDDWNVLVEPFLTFPPDLTITKVANKEKAEPGDVVRYTLVYTNLDPNPDVTASNFTITDDFDERYMTVVDAVGGSVADGVITWTIPGPLGGGESGTISYTLKVDETMPEGTTNVDNVVVIRYPDDPNPDNDRATERVIVGVEEPFLPFTGGDAALFFGVIALASVAGASLRRFARKAA